MIELSYTLIIVVTAITVPMSALVGVHLGRKVERRYWTQTATDGADKEIIHVDNRSFVVMSYDEYHSLNLIEVV